MPNKLGFFYFIKKRIINHVFLVEGNQTILRMFDFVVVMTQYLNNLEFDQICKILQKFIFEIKFQKIDELTMSNIFEKVI